MQDTIPLRFEAAARSSDGQTAYFSVPREARGQRRTVAIAANLEDGQMHDVVHFDELARPHSPSALGIAEYKGWLYFTLSDPQADIWVATVSGLKR